MKKIGLETSITTLLEYYKSERNIYGRCPYCGEPFRLSDVKLTYGKQPPKDMISKLFAERERLEEQINILDDKIEEIMGNHEAKIEQLSERNEERIDNLTTKFEDRISNINENWDNKFDTEVEKRIQKRIREIRKSAIKSSRSAQLGKTIEKLAPMVPGFGHFPYDVRPIFDPIDFVVFDGYYHGVVDEIVFVEFKTGNSRASEIQQSIRKAIEKKHVHYEERRMKPATLELISKKRIPKNIELME